MRSFADMGVTHFMVQHRAKMTLEDAVRHLYHFCATLPAAPYADPNPIFTFEEHSAGGNGKSISAKVLLPNSVDVAVRSACSKRSWVTEKMARKDAAFEAYKALYQAGLVNEHLLPLGHVDEAVNKAYGAVEKRPSIVKISEQIDVWPCIAQCWQTPGPLQGSLIRLTGPGQEKSDMIMLLPVRIPAIAGIIDLYWDQNTTLQLIVQPETVSFSPTVTASAAQITFLLLESVFRNRLEHGRYDFIALFMPSDCMDHLTWLSSYSGLIEAEALRDQDLVREIGLVRDLSHSGKLHIFQSIRNTEGYASQRRQCSESVPDCGIQLDKANSNQSNLIEVKALPKRTDFLHPVPSGNATSAKGSGLRWLPANECEVEKMPFRYSRFALFVPAILHKVQVAMIVESLCNTVLSPLQFQDLSLVTSAISASSAREPTDYQRLETLGDSILKKMTSLTLMAEHLNYHEGIRTYFRRLFFFWNKSSLEKCLRSVYLVDMFQGLVHFFK